MPRGSLWIPENNRPRSVKFTCYKCRKTAYYPQGKKGQPKRCGYRYCPYCGKTMRNSVEE